MDENWKINTRKHKAVGFDESKEKKWAGDFFFIQGADSQYGLISRYIEHQDVTIWDKEIALTEAIVARVNQMEPPPKFFIVCGDLVDAFPGQADRKPQEEAFKRIFGRVRKDVPLLCVCGNHDVGNAPTPDAVDRYRKSFGDDFYSFLCGGVLFMIINSQYLFDSSQAEDLSKEHDEWLDQTLDKAQKDGISRIVVFQHIPWFLKTFDEPGDGYFNLKPEIRNKWLPKMKARGVVALFCGHYHRNAGGIYDGVPVVVTSAIGGQLGDDKSGARIVKISENALQHDYYAIEDLPLKNV